jgi:hypothetical protein
MAIGLAWFLNAPALRADTDSPTGGTPEDPAADLDRPGEVENPYSLRTGSGQSITYLLSANAGGREDQELGEGGGATVLQSELRLGLAPHWEGQLLAGVYLHATDRGDDPDDPASTRSGLGLVTVRAKWTFYSEKDGDFALALVPTLTIPTRRALAGRTGLEPGLILPFAADLDHGLDLQGSVSLTDGHGDDGGRSVQGDVQAGLEYEFTEAVSAYVEPEAEVGEGRPSFSLEQGLTFKLGRRLSVDIGFNEGLGRSRRSHFGYAGVGFAF